MSEAIAVDVKFVTNAETPDEEFLFAAVPRIGERFYWSNRTWIVVDVLHYPWQQRAYPVKATIIASLQP